MHHAFLYISLPSLYDYDLKMPNFTFCGGREHTTTTFFFFSWTSIQPVRIQLLKKCQHLMNNLLKEMKYARLSLKQRDYTFKWHNGHVRKCHSCYVKIHAPNFLYWWLMPFTQGSKEGGNHPTSPLVAKQSNAWGTDPLTPEAGVRAATGEVHATASLQCIWHLHFSSETKPQGGYFPVQL